MAKPVLMPKAGISVESCIITEWLKKPGDAVLEGDILFSYETDKASFECESTESGTLLEVFYGDGEEVPCLVNVCAVGEPGEDVSALRPTGDGGGEPAAQAEEKSVPAAASGTVPDVEAAPTPGDAPAVKISPRARNLAADKNVDIRLARGTGPYGRIIERDIRALMDGGMAATGAAFAGVTAAAPGVYTGTGVGGRVGVGDLTASADAAPAPEYEDVRFTGIRKAISKSMTASLRDIPQLTHTHSFDATELMSYRKKLKAEGEALGLSGISLGDMVLYAVSRLLLNYPDLNAHMLEGDSIRRFSSVNLGFACDTERGLMVPVIHGADRMSLSQISAAVKELAAQARTGGLSPDRMSGGTFTVSNLGAFGVEHFTPVINPPQTGILGVNAIVRRPREKDGEISLYPAMGLSVTYDHRAIDGAPVSRFMQELCGMLEHFTMLLAQ